MKFKVGFDGPWHVDIGGNLRPGYYDKETSSWMEGVVKQDPARALNFAWRQGYAKGIEDGRSNYIADKENK